MMDDRSQVAQQSRTVEVERGEVAGESNVSLLPSDALGDFRTRWERVQAQFVDDPRTAVKDAHQLVAEMFDRLTEGFGRQRDTLEATWSRGEDVSTEDLRVALQRYRSLFNRLLSA
jgi:hypothetical protein